MIIGVLSVAFNTLEFSFSDVFMGGVPVVAHKDSAKPGNERTTEFGEITFGEANYQK